MLREDIVKVFQICGYILLYSFAAVAAGLLGRFAALMAEKCILERLFGDRIKAYMDWLEISRSICILLCATAFLIVSIGLLFLHLIGLLPPEYDEVAVQVVVAFFGLAVFVCMCLVITLVAASTLWIRLWYNERRLQSECVDEERGLLKTDRKPSYGTDHRKHVHVAHTEAIAGQQKTSPNVKVRCADSEDLPIKPQRTWIRMVNLSSVRNLDFKILEERRPSATIYPRGRSVG